MTSNTTVLFAPPSSQSERNLTWANNDPEFLKIAATVPGYLDLVERRRKLSERVAAIEDIDVVALRAAAVRAIADGDDPLEQARKVSAAEADAINPSLALEIAGQASELLFAEAATWFRNTEVDILLRLRVRAGEIRDAATPLVRAGKASSKLVELAAEFESLTATVRSLFGAGYRFETVIAPGAYVAAWPGFYTPHRVTTALGHTSWTIPSARPRWEAHTEELLEWVIQNGIETWVPTRSELSRALRQLQVLRTEMQAVHNARVIEIYRGNSTPSAADLEPIPVLAPTAATPYGTAPSRAPEPSLRP